MITGGEFLAQCLAREGIEFVFGLMSPEVDPLLAALEPHGMKFIPVRHEAAAAYMAEGLFKSTGRVSATVTNPGPGTANLLPGLVNARHEGVPLVAITSQHDLRAVYPKLPRTFQGEDQLELLRPAVKWGAPIFSRDRIAEVVQAGFREMWNGRPGPIQLEVPTSVMYAKGDPLPTSQHNPDSYRASAPLASADQISAAAKILRSAKRPLIAVGAGVDRSEACDGVVKLAKMLGCGLTTSMSGRSAASRDEPFHLYGYGAGADQARQEADVILALGTRLGNIDTPFPKYWGTRPEQKLIQVDIDGRNMGGTRPLALGIISDVRYFVDKLSEGLSGVQERETAVEDLQRYRDMDANWRDSEFASVKSHQAERMHPAAAMQVVGKVFGSDAVYVADGGFTSLWAHFMLPATRPRSYLSILEFGMLGTGIPSAIGAKLGNTDRDVVCVTGDGAAGFHYMELLSAVREGVKITVVVFSEGSWSMEVPNEQIRYGKTFGTEMGDIRWDRIAEGLGCASFLVDSVSELEAALTAAKSSDLPSVVCVRTDREANIAFPKSIAARFNEGYQGVVG